MSEYYKLKLFNLKKYQEILPAILDLLNGKASDESILGLLQAAQTTLNSEFSTNSDFLESTQLLINKLIDLVYQGRASELARRQLATPFDENIDDTSSLVETIINLNCFSITRGLEVSPQDAPSTLSIELRGYIYIFTNLSERFQVLLDEMTDTDSSCRAINSLSEVIILNEAQIQELKQALEEISLSLPKQNILNLSAAERAAAEDICLHLNHLISFVQPLPEYTLALQVTY